MNFGITKTIPKKECPSAVTNLYDGTLKEFEFHMAGKPSKLKVGHYVYTISDDQIVGRLKIKKLIEGTTNPKSGRARTLIMVECPGEKFEKPVPKKGHRGTRYFDGIDINVK